MKLKLTNINLNKNDLIKRFFNWKTNYIKINFNGNQSARILKKLYSKKIKY